MQFTIKKFVYLVNDITNLLLQKERINKEEYIKKLHLTLIIISLILITSIIFNIYLYFR